MTRRAALEKLAFALLVALGCACLWLSSPPTGERPASSPFAVAAAALAREVTATDCPTGSAKDARIEVPAMRASRDAKTGLVRDDDGPPVPGADVRFAVIDSEHYVLCELPAATTDAHGEFPLILDSLEALSPLLREAAVLSVAADVPGFWPADRWWPLAEIQAAATEVVLDLEPRVPGDQRFSGLVVDAAGRAAAGATVQVVEVSPEPGNRLDSAVTADDGRYATMVAVPAGVTVALFATDIARGQSARLAVTADAADIELPVLVLQPRPGRVRGWARFANGMPATDVRIWIRPAHEPPEDESQRDPFAWLERSDCVEVETDAVGSFAFENLVPGEYEIDWAGRVDDDGERDARVVHTDGAPLDLLVQLPRVTVSVIDRDGVPLRAAWYRLLVWSGTAAHRAAVAWETGADLDPALVAEAEVLDGDSRQNWVTPGAFCVAECSFRGAGPVLASCRLLPGQNEAWIDLALERLTAGGVRLRVLAGDGRIAARVAYRARLVRTAGNPIDGIGKQLLGGWRLIDSADAVPLPAGNYAFEVIGDPILVCGFGVDPFDPRALMPDAGATEVLHTSCQIADGAETDVVLHPPRMARLELELVRRPATVTPREGFRLCVQSPIAFELTNGALSAGLLVWKRDAAGTAHALYPRDLPYGEPVSCFACDLLAPGQWILRLDHESLAPLAVPIALRPGANRIELELTER